MSVMQSFSGDGTIRSCFPTRKQRTAAHHPKEILGSSATRLRVFWHGCAKETGSSAPVWVCAREAFGVSSLRYQQALVTPSFSSDHVAALTLAGQAAGLSATWGSVGKAA